MHRDNASDLGRAVAPLLTEVEIRIKEILSEQRKSTTQKYLNLGTTFAFAQEALLGVGSLCSSYRAGDLGGNIYDLSVEASRLLELPRAVLLSLSAANIFFPEDYVFSSWFEYQEIRHNLQVPVLAIPDKGDVVQLDTKKDVDSYIDSIFGDDVWNAVITLRPARIDTSCFDACDLLLDYAVPRAWRLVKKMRSLLKKSSASTVKKSARRRKK